MKLLVIGEICLDVFVKCKIERLCPEAPVPVLCPIDYKDNYGMAGNVIANLKSLSPGVEVDSVTPVNTIVKTRYTDSQTGYIVVRVDEKDKITERIDLKRVIELSNNNKYDAVIISDYNKGFLERDDIEELTIIFHCDDIPVFLDTKKDLGEWSQLVTFVKINEKEYKALTNADQCRNLIVTLGSRGSEWVGHNVIIPVEPIEVADVSGAGDTYLAAFALAFCQMKNDNDDEHRVTRAMLYANKAARIAVSKRGVVAVRQDEV